MNEVDNYFRVSQIRKTLKKKRQIVLAGFKTKISLKTEYKTELTRKELKKGGGTNRL